ncbi:MAG TPA: metal-dependent hydrolase [Methylomirabilota bacterium]|nr:metal-dependent hydrolase [Methylomirabilota bacterium]
MPTTFAHVAVPLALGGGLGRGLVSHRLLAAGMVASALPDLDVVTLHWGIPYAAAVGHRGASHSLLVAALVALIGAAAHRALRSGVAGATLFLFVSMASHGALDALTDGGLGVAFLWPWSPERFFAPGPWRVIEVSPIGLTAFLARAGGVLASEARWVGLPALLLGLGLAGARRALAR